MSVSSYCREEGKDKLIFTTEEELSKPSTAVIDKDTYETAEKGLILDNGEINFHCTCAGTLFTGPCNIEMRDLMICSNKEESIEKCMEQYEALINCELDYPEIYDRKELLEGVDEKTNTKTSKELEQEPEKS